MRSSAPLLNSLLLLAIAAGCTSSEGDVFVSLANARAFAVAGGANEGGADSMPASGGAAGEATASEGGAPSSTCPGAIFCADFETPPMTTVSGSGTIDLVTSPVHGGSFSMRASTQGADDWARLEVPLAGLSRVGFRFWVLLDEASQDLAPHEVYVLAALHPAPELRIGGTNKVSVDAEAGFQLALIENLDPPSRAYTHFELQRGVWHCVRLQIAGEPGTEQALVEIDGSPVAETAADASVLSPGGFQAFAIGVEYALGATPFTLYYDDIVVSETAAPCTD